jgi:hypothetical protein
MRSRNIARACLAAVAGLRLVACGGGGTASVSPALPPITVSGTPAHLSGALRLQGSFGLVTAYPLGNVGASDETVTEMPGTPPGVSLPPDPPRQPPGRWHLVDSATFSVGPQQVAFPTVCDLDVFDPQPLADDPFAGYVLAFFDVTNRTADFVGSANGDRLTQLGLSVACFPPPSGTQWTASPERVYVVTWYRFR